MNRYTYRDIFSSHKVAAPLQAAQAKAKAEKAKAEKAKETLKSLDSLADEIQRLITAFEPFRKGTKKELTTTQGNKIKDPTYLSLEIDKRIKVLTSGLRDNKTIIDSGAYNKMVGRLNNFNTGLATIQKTLKEIDDVKARALKEKQAREAKAATAKK